MKKAFGIITMFVAIASMAFITSCTKDKEDLIVGKWKFEKANMTVTADDPEIQALIDQYLVFEIQELNEEMKSTQVEFKADGTYVATDEEGSNDSGTWEIKGDFITFDGETWTINTLTKSTLILESSEIYDDEDIAGTWTMTLEFKKM